MDWRQVVLARRLLPILLCAVLLTGCRYGGPESLFDDDLGFRLALAQLKSAVGEHARALKIEIESDRIAMSIQDPADRRHVNEWRITRLSVYQFIWDRLSGPSPVALDLMNPNLEENLFNLDDVDFDATARLMKASIERAALEDPGRVTRMEIVRPTAIIPVPSSGDVRWSVRVSSGREFGGHVRNREGQDLPRRCRRQNRARTANFLQRPEYLVDAVRDLREEIGARPVLLQADLSVTNVAFLTSIPDKGSIVATADKPARATYLWNLNGLRRGFGYRTPASINARRSASTIRLEVLPAVVAAAKEKLGMPKGRVEDIKISRPAEGVGAPPLLWEIQITDPNNDKGTFIADVTGATKRMKLPPGRRQPIDWYDPATMVSMIDRIGREFGSGAKFFQLMFMDDKVVITATDPRPPSEPVQVLLTENGFTRFGTASMFAIKSRPFTLAELQPLSAEKLTELKASTLRRLTMPPKSVSSIIVARSFVDPSPRGSVTIESAPRSGRAAAAGA